MAFRKSNHEAISNKVLCEEKKQRVYLYNFVLLASLFFIWGFAQVLNNTLVPHLRSAFNLSYTEATLIGSVWFTAYFLASLPAAKLIKRIGYQRSMVTGLLTMAGGALLMILAVSVPSYTLVLTALFLIAGGVTVLQVAANPYVAVLGPPSTASSRLNFVQAFNSMGSTLAPLFGGWLILSRSRSGMAGDGAATALTQAERLADAHSVELPYMLMAIVLATLAGLIARVRLPGIAAIQQSTEQKRQGSSLLAHGNLIWGVQAIFAYMVAEIGCAALFINFVGQSSIGNVTQAQAANFLFLLWGGMMAGRLVGSVMMYKVQPEQMLAGASMLAFLVLLITVFGSGSLAMWALISVGLFHSIMFPTIFTLSIRDLGPLTEAGSGLLVMAISGGALVVIQGWLADLIGPQMSFILPAFCELYILYFALWGSRNVNATRSGAEGRGPCSTLASRTAKRT